jgi:hypothetical protein
MTLFSGKNHTTLTIVMLLSFALLFFEIYKKVKSLHYAKTAIVILCLFFVLLLASQIEYVPKIRVKVVDVFEQPISGIKVHVSEYLYGGHTFSTYRDTGREDGYYTSFSNNDGNVEFPAHLYFAEPKTFNRSINIGENKQPIDQELESKSFEINKISNDVYEVVLPPYKIEYSECLLINDIARKNECLIYGIFYSAVKNKDPSLCEKYSDTAITDRLKKISTPDQYHPNRSGNLYDIQANCSQIASQIVSNKPLNLNETEHYACADGSCSRKRTFYPTLHEAICLGKDPKYNMNDWIDVNENDIDWDLRNIYYKNFCK